MPPPTLRDETPADVERIDEIQRAAFLRHPFSRHDEHRIVRALRSGGALAMSLVAEQEGRLVGHVAFSPIRIDGRDSAWFGLGPLAVDPPFQRRDVGAALVGAGLARLRGLGAQGCVVLGDPAYYRRFGFGPSHGLRLDGPPPDHFMACLVAGRHVPSGRVAYHQAFDAAAA